MDNLQSQEHLAQQTGVVVPVYYSGKPSDATVERLIWMTLVDVPLYLPPEQVAIVVDGDPRSAAIVTKVVEQLAQREREPMQIIVLPENLGKFGAMRAGMQAILRQHSHVAYLGVIDGDADHMIAVLPRLVRATAFLAATYGHGRVLAIGARASRTRPMGWVRGELERQLDQLTVDALAFALAREGSVLDLSQCLPGRTPDLSSGYKVYARELARMLFDDDAPHLATLTASDYWHYGPETVTIVEMVLGGAVFGEVQRPTWDGQPATSFGEFGVVAMYGELLAWVWARLEIRATAAAQMYDNRRNETELGTAAEGASLLQRLREHALGRLARYRDEVVPGPTVDTLPFV